MKKEEKMNKPISIEEIAKIKEGLAAGEVVDISIDDKPFMVKLKKLSLLELCKAGTIPNTLLGAAQEIYEGRQRADIKKYAEVLDIICSLSLVEPKYEDISGILADAQKAQIFTYSQHGVAGLLPFRQILGLQKDGSGLKVGK